MDTLVPQRSARHIRRARTAYSPTCAQWRVNTMIIQMVCGVIPGFNQSKNGTMIWRRLLDRQHIRRTDKSHAQANPTPATSILKKISSRDQHGSTPNIHHRTLNVQWQKEIRHRSSELRIGRWTMDIGRLPRPCRGTKSLLPSPSNRFSSSECGAGGASNPNFTKSFRRRSVSVNRGKLSIVPKRRASWPAARCGERTLHELWTQQREEIFGDVPDTPRFPLLIKILDAQEKLSLQVHPPENVASRLGGEPKSEFWYVAAADPDAEIFLGFRESITRDRFKERLRRWNRDRSHS